jgi:hypothetical protein
LQEFVAAAGFEPTIALGVSRVVSERLTIAGDVRQRLGDSSIEMVPATHVGAGVEYRALPSVPLRAGLAYVDDGYQVAGGAGVDFGPVGIAAGLMRRSTDLGVDTVVMVTLISTMSR